jgi:hypothetical protein
MFINRTGKLWRMVFVGNSFLLSSCISRQTQPISGERVEHIVWCQSLFFRVLSEILHFFGVQFLLMPVIVKSSNEECHAANGREMSGRDKAGRGCVQRKSTCRCRVPLH